MKYTTFKDTFLEDFYYCCMKLTGLPLGNNEGYACFEIKKESHAGNLALVYDAPKGQDRIKLQ